MTAAEQRAGRAGAPEPAGRKHQHRRVHSLKVTNTSPPPCTPHTHTHTKAVSGRLVTVVDSSKQAGEKTSNPYPTHIYYLCGHNKENFSKC